MIEATLVGVDAMCASRTLALAGLLLMAAPPAPAAVLHRQRASSSRHAGGVSLRKRLHVNDLITEPGTVELDAGMLSSYTTATFTLPSALKYTPEGHSLLWGATEYSIAFDSVASTVNAGVRSTQFSDRLTLAATSVVFDSTHFDLAVAPQLTKLLREDSGVRVGATVVARYDQGRNSMGGTAAWSLGTSASETNPAGFWSFDLGFGRRLGAQGLLARITPHMDALLEKGTGRTRTTSVFGGLEYHMTEKFALDVVAQRYNLTGGSPDRQVLFGMTVNFGQVK